MSSKLCILSFALTETKCVTSTYKKNWLFWLTIMEASVHGCPITLGHVARQHCTVGMSTTECSFHRSQEVKGEKRRVVSHWLIGSTVLGGTYLYPIGLWRPQECKGNNTKPSLKMTLVCTMRAEIRGNMSPCLLAVWLQWLTLFTVVSSNDHKFPMSIDLGARDRQLSLKKQNPWMMRVGCLVVELTNVTDHSEFFTFFF